MKKNIKFVVCDIDNTLIVPHASLSKPAKKIIELLRAKGILFGLASGRPLEDLDFMIENWSIDVDMMIGMNGSSLRDCRTNQEYSYYMMKPEWIKETIDLMKPFHGNPIIYEPGVVVCVKEDEMVQVSASSSNRKVKKVDDISYLYRTENAKIMFRVPENEMADVEAYFKAHPVQSGYEGFKTQSTLYEFANKHTNKGFALKKYCELKQIPAYQVMAFGDTSNDNSMLAYSGLGVCMKNGSQDTKSVADIITKKPCDQDGWADFMMGYAM